jgi:hypothetical protein
MQNTQVKLFQCLSILLLSFKMDTDLKLHAFFYLDIGEWSALQSGCLLHEVEEDVHCTCPDVIF